MTSKDSKQKKAYYKLISINIILIIFITLILNIFSNDTIYSEKENRIMAQKPRFSLSSFFSGTLVKDYESYVSDQFIFRNNLIDIKTHNDKLFGKKQFNGVYTCKDNYLITPFEQPLLNNIIAKEKALNEFFLRNKNLVNSLMIVPTKCAILKDKLPYAAPNCDEETYISNLYKNIDGNAKTVNLIPTFINHKGEYLFYRTDHHWTTLGAYYGYRNFCHSIGICPREENAYDISKVSENFFGSLYSKASFSSIKPDDIKVYLPKKDENMAVTYEDTKIKSSSLYNSKALKTHDKYKVFTDGNHSFMRISSESTSNKNLLLIKDSYANSLIPFLPYHFSNIYVVDLRYYSDNIQDIIEDYNITHTLILYNAETFFGDDSILNLSNE